MNDQIKHFWTGFPLKRRQMRIAGFLNNQSPDSTQPPKCFTSMPPANWAKTSLRLFAHILPFAASAPAKRSGMDFGDMAQEERIWLRFVNPVGQTLRQEIFLGARAVGDFNGIGSAFALTDETV